MHRVQALEVHTAPPQHRVAAYEHRIKRALRAKLILATPPAFLAALAGLALLKVLQSACQVSFQGRLTLGALVTFIVTIADHAVFGIGAPFWG